MEKYKVLTHFIADDDERIKFENDRKRCVESDVMLQIAILEKDNKYYKLGYFGDDVLYNYKLIYCKCKNFSSKKDSAFFYILNILIELGDITDYLDRIL